MMFWIHPEEAASAIREGRGKGIRIAVLDSGIEAGHPRLAGLSLRDDIAIVESGSRLCAVPGEGKDLYGHGTGVAGIIHEMAPEAEIGSIRVLGEALAARTAIILHGAHLAMERGYHILNCSLGCGVPAHVMMYKNWVDDAYLRNVHVVAACNNQDVSRPEWPGFFTSVLTVNMAHTSDADAVYYRTGNLVEFAAQGVDVEVLWSDGGVKKMTGSSFAAPRLTGMLACLLSKHPEISPLQAKLLFQQIAKPWTKAVNGPNHGWD